MAPYTIYLYSLLDAVLEFFDSLYLFRTWKIEISANLLRDLKNT